jgi:predicted HTH domain antitoxin
MRPALWSVETTPWGAYFTGTKQTKSTGEKGELDSKLDKEDGIINLNLRKRGDPMGISVNLPEMNIKEDEVKLFLAMKLLEEGIVSLGKAAEIAGYSEKAFVEILLHKGIPSIKYSKLDLEKELQNA